MRVDHFSLVDFLLFRNSNLCRSALNTLLHKIYILMQMLRILDFHIEQCFQENSAYLAHLGHYIRHAGT